MLTNHAFAAVGVIVSLAIIVAAVMLFGGYDVVQQRFIEELGFALAIFLDISILFGPKTYLIWIKAEFDDKLSIVTKKDKKEVADVQMFVLADYEDNLLTVESQFNDVMKGTKEGNARLCDNQINAAETNIKFGKRAVEEATKHVQDWMEVSAAIDENRLIDLIGTGSIVYTNVNYQPRRASQSTVGRGSVVTVTA